MQAVPQIRIRRAGADDLATIAAVLYESFVQYKDLYTEKGFSATTPGVEHIRRRMEEGPVWVGLRDGVIVGTVSVVTKGDALYIRGMAVVPSVRGSGIGSGLLREVESVARAAGQKRLRLSTTPFLSSAIQLYESFGFRRTDADPHDLFGTPLFTMEKALTSP
jgi:N-acetylglutamate synthase-like GNAT family acetyltransferase